VTNAQKKKSTSPGTEKLDQAIQALRQALGDSGIAPEQLGPSKSRALRKRFEAAANDLSAIAQRFDLVKRPVTVFDPSNPAVVGRFIALTMIAQDRTPLSAVSRFYGAGIYSIYYNGKFPLYRPISRSEHPIYVGKADPPKDAKNAIEQGTKLWDRLNEHRKGITKAKNLRVEDFECRFLVVATGWQRAAEEYLIHLFQPIWNSEVKLIFGIGKHGDAAETRGNKRSPWDTLHPGRRWAGSVRLTDQKPKSQIRKELRQHFASRSPYSNLKEIFSRFMREMHQLTPKP
jgi:hypothetical protein